MKQLTLSILCAILLLVGNSVANAGTRETQQKVVEFQTAQLVDNQKAEEAVPLTEEQQKFLDVLKTTEKSAVKIFGLSSSGMDRCSGVLIRNDEDNTVILTAKHCINTDEELYVEDVPVKRVGVSLDDDLAYMVLEHPLDTKQPIKLAETSALPLTVVFHIGYPTGDIYLSVGYIELRTKDWQFAKLLVQHGCSGGGIYNEEGQLVGILWGMLNDGRSILEPLSDVKKFIEENKLLE